VDQSKLLPFYALLRSCSRQVVLGALLSALVPAVAEAQIYMWRDSAGNLVLSDRAKDPSAVLKTYPVDRGGTIRTTKGTTGTRTSQYDAIIEESAAAHGVNPHLVRAVIQQESAFNPNARSHKGAMGLMQLMPGTAAELGVSDPYSPSQNIRGGVAYLKGLLTKFAQNVELALAAYNAGPSAVTKYGAVPPYRETQNYVTRITSAVGVTPEPKRTRIFKTVTIVNGRKIASFSSEETPGSVLVGGKR
jgi:soluble lytic murein transglycosylase-like protein